MPEKAYRDGYDAGYAAGKSTWNYPYYPWWNGPYYDSNKWVVTTNPTPGTKTLKTTSDWTGTDPSSSPSSTSSGSGEHGET